MISMFFTFSSCDSGPEEKCMPVKVSAYNSVGYQTRPGTAGNITAWGDTLQEDTRSIAISRDLLDSGLVYGTMVKIEGYEEPFKVNDKMNRRFNNKIDLHFGTDIKKAREFGNQELSICFDLPEEEKEEEEEENV
jgi:3D (Asp-Asp-Asp) domain-containing protein